MADLPHSKTFRGYDYPLLHGIPIETVSRILGHTNIKISQIYARITDQKISRDMETLSHKLEGMKKNICEVI